MLKFSTSTNGIFLNQKEKLNYGKCMELKSILVTQA